MHSPDRKPTALGYALLTYMTLVIAAITLIPFEFKVPGRIYINLHGTVSDVLTNVVLFTPLGFLFQLARRRVGWRYLLQALGFGVLVSTAVEACQLFLPGRDSSVASFESEAHPQLIITRCPAASRRKFHPQQNS